MRDFSFCISTLVSIAAISVTASGSAHAAAPTTQTAAVVESPYMKPGEDALANGRYKEALATFQDLATKHADDFQPLHGAGIACLYLRHSDQANPLLARALALAPVANRALSYNYAVSDMNLGNYRRAAQTLTDYLYANPKTLDEPLDDALGACLYQTGEKNTASRVSDDTRKFYAVYTAKLEAQRPGYRKWGPQWLPAKEVDARQRKMRDAETKLALLAKDLSESTGRLGAYHQELQASEYGHGLKSADDASTSLGNEDRHQQTVREKYDHALAVVDESRPDFPQLLLPMAMDDLTPPPLPTLPDLTVAKASPSAQPPVESTPEVGDIPPNPPVPKRPKRRATPKTVAPAVVPTVVAPAPKEQVAGPVIDGVSAEQSRQCRLEADGAIGTDHESKLTFRGTEGHDFNIKGEMFLGGTDENGGIVFYLREANGTHRYELTGGGMRAKRVLVAGQMVARFANPLAFNTPKKVWLPFEVDVMASEMTVTFGTDSTGTVAGPLSTAGSNSIVLSPGGELRNVALTVDP